MASISSRAPRPAHGSALERSLLLATLEATADGILVVDLAGRMVRFNERFAKLWGIPQSILQSKDDARAISFVLSQLVDPDAFIRKIKELYSHPDAESFDVLEFNDGRVFERYSIPQRAGGKAVGRVWSFRDVTGRVRDERERAAAEHRARRRLHRLETLWRLLTNPDLSGSKLAETVLAEGRRSLDLDYATLSQVAGERIISDVMSPTDDERPGPRTAKLEATLAALVVEAGHTLHSADLKADPAFAGDPRVERSRIRAAIATKIEVGGREFVLGFGSRRARVEPFPHEDREYVELLAAYFGRLLRMREQQEQITYLAYHDSLTGLENRRRCLERLEEAIARSRRTKRKFAFAYVDLDRFKEVNDVLGHVAGDAVLAEAGKRLRAALRAGDAAARFGGDEFAVLMTETAGPTETDQLARRVVASLSEPYRSGGREVPMSACIGIAMYPEDGSTASELIASADAALYRAKEQGRSHIAFYSQEIAARLQHRHQLQRGLRAAMDAGEFALVYQPVVRLTDGAIEAIEALIRWNSPQRGVVFPAEFIPAAEESGLMIPLGDWVIRTAAARLASWRKAGRDWRMAVNISAIQLHDPLFVAQLSTAVEDAGVPSHAFKIEITESAALRDTDTAQATVAEIRRLGFKVALDDFGTYYASLSHLKKLPVDIIKVDRSFVRGLPDDPNDAAIVRSVLALGTNFGCTVVAEGVETEAQASWLVQNGCAFGQGFLLGKPMDPDELERWVSARQARR